MAFFSYTEWIAAPRSTPPGTVMFAVGDVHGHAAELEALQQLMGRLGSVSPEPKKCHVYLGDYIVGVAKPLQTA